MAAAKEAEQGGDEEEGEVEYRSTPLLRRAVAGTLESDADAGAQEVLRSLLREKHSRDDAYAAIIAFCRRDLRDGSRVLSRGLQLLRSRVQRNPPSFRILRSLQRLCADIRSLCARAHARAPHASSGGPWLDKQALVLLATCSALCSRLQTTTSLSSKPSRPRRPSPAQQPSTSSSSAGSSSIWPPSTPPFPPPDALSVPPASMQLDEEDEDDMGDLGEEAPGARAVMPPSAPNGSLHLIPASDVDMSLPNGCSASGPSSQGTAATSATTTTTTSSSSAVHAQERMGHTLGDSDELRVSASNSGSAPFLNGAHQWHGEQRFPTLDELVYAIREHWRGEEPTTSELESARARRERSQMYSLSERARREGPACNIQRATLDENGLPALIGAALRGADGWGVDSPATCALASELVSKIADSLNTASQDKDGLYSLTHMLMRFLEQGNEAVRARAYDLLASAALRASVESSDESVRTILFELSKRTLRHAETSEKVWLALLNCLTLLCSSNGELELELIEDIQPAVLCELCCLSGKLGWPLHVQAHLSIGHASRASRCRRKRDSTLFAEAGGASRLLRSCVCVQDTYAFSMLLALAAMALAEDGCLNSSSRLFHLLCKQPTNVNASLLLLVRNYPLCSHCLPSIYLHSGPCGKYRFCSCFAGMPTSD